MLFKDVIKLQNVTIKNLKKKNSKTEKVPVGT